MDGEVQDYGYQGVMDGGSAADGQPRDYEVEQPASWDAYMEDQLLESIEQRIEEYERDPEWEPHSNWGTVGGLLKGTIRAKLRPQPDPWKATSRHWTQGSGNLGDAEDTYQVRNRRQSSVQDKGDTEGREGSNTRRSGGDGHLWFYVSYLSYQMQCGLYARLPCRRSVPIDLLGR